jgi:hypothetical protein
VINGRKTLNYGLDDCIAFTQQTLEVTISRLCTVCGLPYGLAMIGWSPHTLRDSWEVGNPYLFVAINRIESNSRSDHALPSLRAGVSSTPIMLPSRSELTL